MRAFIGILAPEGVRNAGIRMQEELRNSGVIGKFVEPQNLHLNLSFLDEITEEELQEFGAKLDLIAKGYKRVEIQVSSLKAIPNTKFARVVAFGVSGGNDALTSLSRDIQKSIGGDVKPPHMTLCRVKELKDKKAFGDFIEKNASMNFASFEIDSVQIIKSELTREGPIYSVVHESKFSM